jgi:NAD+ synthase
MAEYLGVPEEIRKRPPTTDTYSMPQSQDEFYFSLPYHLMDLCLYGKNNGIPVADIAASIGASEESVLRVFKDIDQKRRTTEYLHLKPQLLGSVAEVGGT